MAVTFFGLNSAAGLKKLNDYLLDRSYITGSQASKDDLTVHAALSKPPSSEFVNVSRWYNHIAALFSAVFGEVSGVIIETRDAASTYTPSVAETRPQLTMMTMLISLAKSSSMLISLAK
ncbi:hypothetical protein C1H46_016066 [Malus baccata]|uniref:Translation elongation factor EF1B beta/delta subunit guanine nucleotide exchange domain-containing protein n=1 Tax=Malus baccata TaxID=106549 RepID=A0A540MHK5_MALBA|nr:hypothetical protein C1H46_016066 [Malus baccata]